MRDPLLFWASLAALPVAIVCFVFAMRVTSQRSSVMLQIVGEFIAGFALPLMGYEAAFRSAGASILEMKSNAAVGLLFIMGDLLCIGDLIAKVFDK